MLLTYDDGLSDQLAHQLDEGGLSLLSLATLEGIAIYMYDHHFVHVKMMYVCSIYCYYSKL